MAHRGDGTSSPTTASSKPCFLVGMPTRAQDTYVRPPAAARRSRDFDDAGCYTSIMSDDSRGTSRQFPLLVMCPACKKPVMTNELGIRETRTSEGPVERYSFLECISCENPLLVLQEDNGWGDGLGEPVRLWPSLSRTLSRMIPASLRREVAEAHSCFNAKAYTATVVMVRRTLEGVCAEHNVTKKPLVNALKEMAAQDLLDGRLLTWADELRVLGNEGAHYTGSRVSWEDAKDALAFAEAVLDYLYVLGKQFEEFQKRRAKQPTTAPQPLVHVQLRVSLTWRLSPRATIIFGDAIRR
jgi:hypothetical protein